MKTPSSPSLSSSSSPSSLPAQIESHYRQFLELNRWPAEAIPENTFEKLGHYLELLGHWSKTHDLIAPASVEEQIRRHIVDGLACSVFTSRELKIEKGKGILDVGSGAGLPGVVLSIVNPELELYLCEPRAKRVAFLTEVRRVLALSNVRVIEQRAEQLSATELPGLKLAVSRAVGRPELLFSVIGRAGERPAHVLELLGPSDISHASVNLLTTDLATKPTLLREQSYQLSAGAPKFYFRLWQCFT